VNIAVPAFAHQIVRWQERHGRNTLPWQNTRDPYRVWLSEIMLQQTQVATVLDYYARFLNRFPNVQALSKATLDDVLALWSGLGYYSRARNLHACAVQVMQQHGGAFPATAEALQTLPGIGKSTAGAIASLCFGERVAILDGNVKRVLTRVLGFDADLAVGANERALWELASQALPAQNQYMPRYTQGMMDLGATVCLSRKPLCDKCPLRGECLAKHQGQPEKYPVKTRKLKRSAQSIWLLWVQTSDGRVHLTKRPSPGVWAGLYCFALFDSRAALVESVDAHWQDSLEDAVVFTHVLTHKDLHLHPVRLTAPKRAVKGMGGDWFSSAQIQDLGLPAPIKKLLSSEQDSGGQPAV
jgi:A/G-specific adenine glycosylase